METTAPTTDPLFDLNVPLESLGLGSASPVGGEAAAPKPIYTMQQALDACVFKLQLVRDHYYFRTEQEAEQAGKVFRDKSNGSLLSGRSRELDYFDYDYGCALYGACYFAA